MAHAKNCAKSPEWWKHLRWTKRVYWKRVRAAYKHVMREERGR